ncbi:hypothetical protein H0H87_002473, partial [Tephrocybe sp. NHM501043]
RVGVEDVAEELAGDGDAGNDEAVDVERVNDEAAADRITTELAHPVKVDQQGEEDLVRCRAVLEDAEELRFKRYCGDIARVEGESGSGGGKGDAGCR